STPLCTPTRVQIMSGKYNHRNYIGFGILREGEQTFGHLMQQAGYRTGIVGKWQLWGNKTQQKLINGRHGSLPEGAGFDEYCLWQIKERGYRYKGASIQQTGQDTAVTYPGEYGPDLFLKFINGFMERNQEKPFFLYYPMVLVHNPFQHTPDTEGYTGFDPDTRLDDTTYFKNEIAYMDKIVGKITAKLDEQ
ncbi:MAG: sulfatase-like hydrolase/transferase, partial [bacterium]|nr:sulfatase-like hydrolase/transferase [bacterium]